MRTLKLSHKEIELLETALQYAYDKNLEIVRKDRKVLGEECSKSIIDSANKYFDIQEQIRNGEKDV